MSQQTSFRRASRFPLTAIAAAALAATALVPLSAKAADVLSGSITSASGEKLAGVTVSAKAEGSTITTTVFTDEGGNYYFPPLPSGRYRVWVQALTFATAKSEVDLATAKHQDFKLDTLADFERQLPGDLVLASLPDDTPEDARLKNLVHNNCTGCHTPSYPLQHKFDAAGWSAIIDLMKHVNVSGVYLGPDRLNGVLDFNEKELAAYLARARGPGETSMKFKLRPRPTGEAARVVFKEYDVPLESDANLPVKYKTELNDGSDWSLGTPSRVGSLVHDSWADLDGNIWFTSNVPNHVTSIGRIDAQTGAVKMFKVNGQNGMAANTHGMTRDPNGIIWFNVNPGKGSLGRLDPRTEQIQVFQPPNGMSGTGGATTVDWDGKGKIWVSSPEGALRFDPATETFTEYKSLTYKTPNGTGTTYGAAGDRDGNGWWAEMTLDTIGHGDAQTGKTSELKLPRVAMDKDLISDAQRAFYEKYSEADFNQPVPWNEGPRRMGSDKNGDVLWVGNSWGGTLAKINIHTMETSFVPLPGPGVMQPYHVAVDSAHNAWLNIWTSDVIMRFDPTNNKWTTFDLPTRGTEARYISLLERDGKLEVVLPYSRASKVATMTFRSEADLQALKAQAGQ
ncbi:MAG TPA: carboxypeptidase regulatory-like domain-containing protein [Xanthobacteraceae bacterium]|nr:carboxypeptidase regulatory-like domain-containing protein [Xanthobacteraceae bacterium]